MMKKVYAVGAFSQAELGNLRDFCQQNGWSFSVAKAFGRPTRNIDVEKVLDAFEKAGTIRGTARLLSLPPGTVQGILRRAGVLSHAK
jgi:hypothetical protein